MNFKLRLTLLFISIFVLIFVATLAFIYFSFEKSRQLEFFERLRQHSEVTARFLARVSEDDKNLLKIIDQNSISQLYDEKILVFDNANNLVYSSLDDKTIHYSAPLLKAIRQGAKIAFIDDDGDETVGIHFTDDGKDYVILASAFDKYGKIQLEKLLSTLLWSLFAGALLIFTGVYFYIRQVFQPIDRMNSSIRTITENNLNQYLPVKRDRDELDQLAINYNQMLGRLKRAFEMERLFVHNASHELKTPFARMSGKIEQALTSKAPNVDRELLQSLLIDVGHQADLIESLLMLSTFQSNKKFDMRPVRIDELLYQSMDEIKELFPDIHISLDVDEHISSESQLTIAGNPILLKTCLMNLLKNAANYHSEGNIDLLLTPSANSLSVVVANKGEAALDAEKIFQPFHRGEQSGTVEGSGLGLSIVRQIASVSGGSIAYAFEAGTHRFALTFPLQN